MTNRQHYILIVPALFASMVFIYALAWLVWTYMWLAIPIWIAGYFLDRKCGIGENRVDVHPIKYISKILKRFFGRK